MLTDRYEYELQPGLRYRCRHPDAGVRLDAPAGSSRPPTSTTPTATCGSRASTAPHGVTGDERTTYYTYYPNTTAYIVGAPGTKSIYQGNCWPGSDCGDATHPLKQQARLYYDGNGSYTTAPIKGAVTKKEVWNDQTGTYAASNATLDTYGNVTREVNPLGGATTHTFDSTYHAYETQTCSPLSQCSSSTWDYTLGAVTAVTDINSRQATTQLRRLRSHHQGDLAERQLGGDLVPELGRCPRPRG